MTKQSEKILVSSTPRGLMDALYKIRHDKVLLDRFINDTNKFLNELGIPAGDIDYVPLVDDEKTIHFVITSQPLNSVLSEEELVNLVAAKKAKQVKSSGSTGCVGSVATASTATPTIGTAGTLGTISSVGSAS